MARDVDAAEDAAENAVEAEPPEPSPPGRSGPLIWLGLGVLIGFGVGLLFIGQSPDTEPAGDATTESGLGAPLEEGENQELGALLPQVIGVERVDGANLQQIVGPVTGPFTTQPLPVSAESEVVVDESGRWLAARSETPDGGEVLMFGKLPSLVPTSTNVDSFAWHDARSGVLSYIENTDGAKTLKIVEAGQDPQVITSGAHLDGRLAAWGDWGFALQRESGTLAILDTQGDVAEVSGGLILDSHGTGWIVTVTDGGLINVVIPGGGTVWIDIDYESIGGVGMASLSPDRKKIALVGPIGVKVGQLNREGDALTVPLGSLPTAASWSPDSRFLILSQRSGAMVLDTWARGDQQAIHELGGRSLMALSVIR